MKRTSVVVPGNRQKVRSSSGKSLAQRGRTAEDTTAATAWLAAAFEIVGSRMANWDIKFVDIVADNASSGLFVLGREQRPVATIDLVNCMMRMTRDGHQVSRGSGTACMGNPLNAAVWLAGKWLKFAAPFQAGDVILSGAPWGHGAVVLATASKRILRDSAL